MTALLPARPERDCEAYVLFAAAITEIVPVYICDL